MRTCQDFPTRHTFITLNYFELSAQAIADELGITKSKVNRRIKALGLPSKAGHPDSLAHETYTLKEMAFIAKHRDSMSAAMMGGNTWP